MKSFNLLTGLIAICLAGHPIPYHINERSQPTGTDFSKLMPVKVGPFNRISYKDPAPGLDGEATYRYGNKEIFMLFSKADTKNDLQETLKTILDEIKENKTTGTRIIEVKKDPSFIHFTGPRIAFFAWTRGLYCFSADSKNADKKSLDDFMNEFPY